jgi:8-oxo-dGTP pyrophosphatase MutT (NUDIX family)
MQKKNFYCINCGKDGHLSKNCDIPITSYGVILLQFENIDTDRNKIIEYLKLHSGSISNNTDLGISIEETNDVEVFCTLKNSVKFLLIQRKHTLGFLEFIRGRYSIENVDGIAFLFKQMIATEIAKIRTKTFDELWDEVWGDKNKINYQNEYMVAKDKFDKLKNENNKFLSLKFYIDNVVPTWNYAEWGFPKGRRNLKENDRDCAIREFMEETNITPNNFVLLDNIEPLEETFIGTNGINYKHVYYIGIAPSNYTPAIDPANKIQVCEIGDIKFLSYEETIKLIRPYHTERRRLVTLTYIFFMNKIIKYYNNIHGK